MLQYEARRRAAQEAAGARAMAGFQNAQDVYQLNQTDINQRLGNMGLPGTLVQQRLNIENAPEAAYLNTQLGRQSLMNTFKLAPATPPYAQPYFQAPVASPLGLAATGAGQLGGAVGNYYLYKNLYGHGGGQPGGAGAPYGFNQPTGYGTNWQPLAGGGGSMVTNDINYGNWAQGMNPPSGYEGGVI